MAVAAAPGNGEMHMGNITAKDLMAEVGATDELLVYDDGADAFVRMEGEMTEDALDGKKVGLLKNEGGRTTLKIYYVENVSDTETVSTVGPDASEEGAGARKRHPSKKHGKKHGKKHTKKHGKKHTKKHGKKHTKKHTMSRRR